MIAMRHYCGELLFAEYHQRSYGLEWAMEGCDDNSLFVFFPRQDREGRRAPIETCPKCSERLDIDFCGQPYLVEPMPYASAVATAQNRFCSNCWGFDWEIIEAKDLHSEVIGYRVICSACKEDTIGYVSDRWVLESKANDRVYFRRDVVGIAEALEISLPETYRKPDAKRALEELGF